MVVVANVTLLVVCRCCCLVGPLLPVVEAVVVAESIYLMRAALEIVRGSLVRRLSSQQQARQ
jgi:hypothetical protein